MSTASRKTRRVVPINHQSNIINTEPNDLQETSNARNPQSINSKMKPLGQSNNQKQDATSFYDDEFESFEESYEEEIEDQ